MAFESLTLDQLRALRDDLETLAEEMERQDPNQESSDQESPTCDPSSFGDRVLACVVGPDGAVKQEVCHEG
jgi:hypothetical protein